MYNNTKAFHTHTQISTSTINAYMYVPYLLVNRAMAHTEQTSFDRIDPCQDLKMKTSSSDRVWQFRQQAKQIKSIFSRTKLLDSIDAVYSSIEL